MALSGLALIFFTTSCQSQAPRGGSASLAEELLGLQQRAQARATLHDHGDLRNEARWVLSRLGAGVSPHRDLGPLTPYATPTLPATIRVWRRSLGGSASCSSRVDVLPLEEYVKGVLPHEWIASWDVESLRAGAIAIRSYASAWVAKGGKYTCADLCDTTRSQVYKDSRNAKASQAVDDTRGLAVVEAGKVVFAEYSAENGDPTKFGVSDPPCAGKTLYGHGRGMCQWGSQRWALQGKGHRWIAEHYYPNSQVISTTPRDAGVPPLPDLGPDSGPLPDQGLVADLLAPRDVSTPRDTAPEDSAPEPNDAWSGWPDRGTTPARPSLLVGGCGALPGHDHKCPFSIAFIVLITFLVRQRRGHSGQDKTS